MLETNLFSKWFVFIYTRYLFFPLPVLLTNNQNIYWKEIVSRHKMIWIPISPIHPVLLEMNLIQLPEHRGNIPFTYPRQVGKNFSIATVTVSSLPSYILMIIASTKSCTPRVNMHITLSFTYRPLTRQPNTFTCGNERCPFKCQLKRSRKKN